MMRDPMAMARALIYMGTALGRRNRRIEELEDTLAVRNGQLRASRERVEELQMEVQRLKEDNAALDQTLTDTETQLAAWEKAADVLGPVGRPE